MGGSLPPPPHAHPIDVKVLRLSKPTLVNGDAVDGPSLPTTELSLPRATGPVCVGEKFTCLISVSNRVHEDVDVQLSIEIATPDRQRVPIDQSPSGATKALAPGEMLDVVASYEIVQLGQHALLLSASYKTSTETRAVRKTFKFESFSAVTVRTKTSPLVGGRGIVETQIENILDSVLTITDCELQCEDGWTPHNVAEKTPQPILRPRDVFQYCFIVDGSRPASRDLGKLHVKWAREPLGLEGSLTSGQLRL